MKSTRKSIWLCATALLICLTMLMGTTFAWFTDSISNSGNTITAGTLGIDAYAYRTVKGSEEGGQSFTITGVNDGNLIVFVNDKLRQDLKKDTTPIITEENFEPKKSGAKLLTVKNSGTLAVNVSFEFSASGSLTEFLYFDFLKVGDGAKYKLTEKEMSTIADYGKEHMADIPLQPGESVSYIFVYGMNENVDNDAQGKKFEFSMDIKASQMTSETDGFGESEYDEEASYGIPVSAENFVYEITNLEANESVELSGDITINDLTSFPLSSKGDTVIDLNNHKLTITSLENTFTLSDGKNLVLKNGTVEITRSDNSSTSAVFNIKSNSSIWLEGVTFTTNGAALFPEGDAAAVTVKNSTITAPVYCVATNASVTENHNVEIYLESSTFNATKGTTDNAPILINVPGTLDMINCTVNSNRQSVIVRGGTAILKDCTLNNAADFDGNDYPDGNWGSGNEVPMAALVVGNRSSSAYQYPASCELINTKFTGSGTKVYIYGNEGEGLGAALTYDSSCGLNDNDIVKGKNVTINGNETIKVNI